MKLDVKDLFEIYRNQEKDKKPSIKSVRKGHVLNPAKEMNIRDQIYFSKDRQRAELLKLNAGFLKELSQIKRRLGKEFFRLLDIEIKGAEKSFAKADKSYKETIAQSDFAEPVVLMATFIPDEHTDYSWPIYYRPGTPILNNGWPEKEVDDEEDPLFKGEKPLEWIIINACEVGFVGGIDISSPSFKVDCKVQVFENYSKKWNAFLAKWHISNQWDGNLDYLHLHALPSIIVDRSADHNLPVVIQLGAWATLKDVEKAWPSVEKTMKEARVYRERGSENFLRDLIWYRQNTEYSMKPSRIAQEWGKAFPKEIDLEVIEKITRDDNTFEGVPLEERLEEVLSDDPSLAELRGRLIEARKTYIREGLVDKVKKSIKKMRERINRIGSYDWDRNRERLLKEV